MGNAQTLRENYAAWSINTIQQANLIEADLSDIKDDEYYIPSGVYRTKIDRALDACINAYVSSDDLCSDERYDQCVEDCQ